MLKPVKQECVANVPTLYVSSVGTPVYPIVTNCGRSIAGQLMAAKYNFSFHDQH